MLTCEQNGCGPRIKVRGISFDMLMCLSFFEKKRNYIEKKKGPNWKQQKTTLTWIGTYRHTSCACHWDTIFLSWPYANGCSGPQKRSRFCCNLPIRRISGVLVIFLSCVCLIFELQADCTRSLVPTRWKDSGAQGWLLSGLRPNSMLAWYEFGLFQLRPPPY